MTTRACLGMPPEYANWKEKSINRWLSPIFHAPADGQFRVNVRVKVPVPPDTCT